MPILQDPLAIFALLMLNIVISEQLAKLPYLRSFGSALIVIILTAITANLGIIPSSTNAPPLYDGIFTYLAPVSIFYLLLTVNLRGLKKAGAPMVLNFLLGTLGTMLGTLLAMYLIVGPKSFGESFYALGGMFTGTYIGGSSNFNALALHYEVNKQGNLYAAAIAADNIITAIWMVVTLLLPPILNRYFPRKNRENLSASDQQRLSDEADAHINDRETMNPQELGILLGLGALSLYLSQLASNMFPAIPKIIFLTTIALVLAQFPYVQRLRGVRLIGMFCIYLFLAVIGAYCDLAALLHDGNLAIAMMGFVTILVLVHGVVVFGIGGFFKQDWDILSIASQANVGGSASALALSKGLNRPDLHLPGILAGALGNAIGTYCGLLIAEYLKNWG
ncbi:DUF819 domain-containing protein [Haliscomenobacter hydrossis]|uniref:DUF819 family protein n=1 Tax=Haliscomenobacter hydrossis (strain ATCC 27775 / DSM 1100 / LMG 10767 / O) TaxID=760192 RepID=F4KP64_HALH1|nr:DUF819 family protein [Haliscomenobacter hydrossis]AEE48858.1 protein of unknown function DUF819 [Haliscomenobacter hydrossis DSM 1100]